LAGLANPLNLLAFFNLKYISLIFIVLVFIFLTYKVRMAWFLFFLSFPLWISSDIRIPFLTFFGLPICTLFLIPITIHFFIYIFIEKLKIPVNMDLIFPLLFFSLLLFTTLYGNISLKGPGFDRLIKILIGISLYFLIFISLDISDCSELFKTLLVATLLLTIYLIIMYFFVWKVNILGGNLLVPSVWGKNQLAIFLAIILPMAFSLWVDSNKFSGFILTIIFEISLILTQSRAGLISANIGLISILLLSKRRYKSVMQILFLITTLLLIFNFIPSNLKDVILLRILSVIYMKDLQTGYHSIELRILMDQISLRIFSENPILGIGIGKFQDVIPWGIPHNDYLWILLEGGIITFAVFFIFCFSLLVRSYKTIRNIELTLEKSSESWIYRGLFGALVSVLIMFYSMAMHDTLPTWFVFGLVAALNKKGLNQKEVFNA